MQIVPEKRAHSKQDACLGTVLVAVLFCSFVAVSHNMDGGKFLASSASSGAVEPSGIPQRRLANSSLPERVAYGSEISQDQWESEYDFVVRIHGPRGVCTGLLWGNKVLTAAHCTSGTYRITAAASSDLTANGGVRSIKSEIHPRYDESGNGEYDFMVLTLERGIENTANVFLKSTGNDLKSQFMYAGMGANAADEPGYLPDKPVTTTYWPTLECPNSFHESFTCLQSGLDTSQSNCGGDSGGPILFWASSNTVVLGGVQNKIGGYTEPLCGDSETFTAMSATHLAYDWLENIAPGHFQWTTPSYTKFGEGACGIEGEQSHEYCYCNRRHCETYCDFDQNCKGHSYRRSAASVGCAYFTDSKCHSECIKGFEGSVGAITSSPYESIWAGCFLKPTPEPTPAPTSLPTQSPTAAPTMPTCPALNTNQAEGGRCGSSYGRCNAALKSWALYCNEQSGWCGKEVSHELATEGDMYDFEPRVSCAVALPVCPALNIDEANGGRCGPIYGRCNQALKPWALYCNEGNGWCGGQAVHAAATGGDMYDFKPEASCAIPSLPVCPALNTNQANGTRCGPSYGRCNKALKSWAVFCNEGNGWCGSSPSHATATEGDMYDFEPKVSCSIALPACPALNTDGENGGRCGPSYGRCNQALKPWALYCNEVNGWCGSQPSHAEATAGDMYDFSPQVSCE